MTKIAIGCDHAAFEVKEKLKFFLRGKGYEVLDVGTNSVDSVDTKEACATCDKG